MNDAVKQWTEWRAVIESACHILQQAREGAAAVEPETYASSADCYILLHDATKFFCRAISELYGEPGLERWSPLLPELLLAHPDRCEETLALLERREFEPLSYFEFVGA